MAEISESTLRLIGKLSEITEDCHLLKMVDRDRNILVRELDFLVRSGASIPEFIIDFKHELAQTKESNRCIRRAQVLMRAMSREREKLLERTKYLSKECFIHAYLENREVALSRLFGEYMDSRKVRHADGVAPEKIYDMFINHGKDPLNKWETQSEFTAMFMQIAARF